NGTTIAVGGGVQLLQLPDIRYTFFSSTTDGRALGKQKNDDFDDYGGAVSGSVETPLGFWGSTPVMGVVSGFFANVDDGDRHSCVSRGTAICTVEDIVDHPDRPDSLVANSFVTKTDRDVDFWGVGAEARLGKVSGPILPRGAGGYLFRLAYVGVGADMRGIDQDIRLRVDIPGAANPAVRLNETLDTTYWGGFLSIGGEYNILGYLGIGKGWGLRSLVSLRAGIYHADTDYRGLFRTPARATRLGLSDDEVAFIGGLSFETRKQFGARTSLSLLTDYEYFSYAPEMRYVDADRSGCSSGPGTPQVNCAGNVTRTHIADDDAFAVRTMLRLNIGLGSAPLYVEPMK
ncbi:MAG: hypothetical protein ACOYB4_06580, partial [Methyloceanibacter sp.]